MGVKKVGYKRTWSDQFYLIAAVKGMLLTLRHMLQPRDTVQYPREVRPLPSRFRGTHRLNKDAEGRVKCVACYMCSTACPAECIHIEAAEAPWGDREKYPVQFDIDMLRCIFCGMCEEACPVEAIELTPTIGWAATSRESMVLNKEQLLEMFDRTKASRLDADAKWGGY